MRGRRGSERNDFRRWMGKVDEATRNRAGLSIHDLPDQPFRDLWASGLRPVEVVDQVLADEGFEDWP